MIPAELPHLDALTVELPTLPYPGLRPFEKREWPIFFGRELITDEVIGRLVERHVVVLHGSSGSGKSSLIRAGVLPRLEQEHAGSGLAWRTTEMIPGNEPLRRLAEALAKWHEDGPSAVAVLAVRRALNRGREAAGELVRILPRAPHEHYCILIDQFEELFELAKVDRDQVALFMDIVVGLTDAPPDGLYAAITMRSDYLGACGRFSGLAEAVNRTQYLLPRMDHADLLRAIREPASLYGGEVGLELAERLIADARDESDELPLVQHGLMLLWRETAAADPRGRPPRLSFAHYAQRSSLAAMLSSHAEAVLASIASDETTHKTVELVFRALTDINTDGQAVRQRRTFADLSAITGAAVDRLRLVVDAFRADGVSFLRPYAPAAVVPASEIDISHEALIRCWSKISDPKAGWLHQEFRDGLIWRSLLVAAESFEADDKDVLGPRTTDERERWLTRRNAAWARRYGGGWERVLSLMAASRAARDRHKRPTRMVPMRSSAFVVRPFGKKRDSAGSEFDFEAAHTALIGPALAEAGLAGSTTGEMIDAGNIREDMLSLLLEADLVVCDITLPNANVFYELGIRHALRRRSTLLIKQAGSADSPPFDLLTDRYFVYSLADPDAKAKLVESIEVALRSDRSTDSPIFSMLPDLSEADPSSVQVLPQDFREEAGRARAARSRGWLRLLADDVRGRRFERPGLQLVAAGQWDLKDYTGAQRSLEGIRAIRPDDVTANLALASVYERLYRDDKRPELLASSYQAIGRVLASREVSRGDRVEALALQGRNQKTRWRLEFAGAVSLEQRRTDGMSQSLRECVAAFRAAFAADLNHFWSGLAALQMGAIFLDLSEANDAWKATFDDDAKADAYRRELVQDIAALHHVVPASVDAALARVPANDPDRIWAEVSKVDVLFLTDQNDQRVVNRYRDSVPSDKPFVWDAARGQLQLFVDLGVRAGRAEKVIQEVDRKFAGMAPPTRMPVHVVLFAGHRIDGPGRPQPRFPAGQADRAKSLIRDALARVVSEGSEMIGFASAAPGGDLLFHEACGDLGIRSILCLPMPAEEYSRQTFQDLDEWRSRFLGLRERNRERRWDVLELSDQAGLPRWLQAPGRRGAAVEGTSVDPWERGNRWVLQMGLASGAEWITLLALWDGKPEGDRVGGTAQMVQLARDAGVIDVKVIDASELLR